MAMHEYFIQMVIIMKVNLKIISGMDSVRKYTRMVKSNKESSKMISFIPMSRRIDQLVTSKDITKSCICCN